MAITWKDAPENQYPILGQDYTIRCEVTATPSPTVDWIKDDDQVKFDNIFSTYFVFNHRRRCRRRSHVIYHSPSHIHLFKE